MLGRLLFAALAAGLWWVLSHDDTRNELVELMRDASDRLMMGFLRATSGFAGDIRRDFLGEERERRLRWR